MMTAFTRTSWIKWLQIRGLPAALIAVGLLVGFGCQRNSVGVAPVGPASVAATDGERADGRPRWKSIRSLVVGDVWAASPDGRYVATIDEMRLRVTSALAGPVLHHVALPIAANDLVVTRTNVVCYKRLDPASTQVAILDIKSGKWTRIETNASIWTIAADNSGDGIWMSCGDHTVRHYPKLDPAAAGMTKIVLTGFGGTLASDPRGCIVTEALPAGITAISNEAVLRWHIEEENPKRLSRLMVTRSGATYIDSTERSKPENHTITSISAVTGAPIWEIQHSGKRIHAAADQRSGMLAVSVGTPTARVTSKLYAYNRDGSSIMDGRGSGYFTPMLVGVSENGHRITVFDGQRGLTTLSDSGSTLARRMQLPSINPELLRGQFARLSSDDHYLFIQSTSNNVHILEALYEE
ncbi:MAG: hypothetical protein RLZZ78_351 [Armatimonadota bacterium]